MAQAPLKSTKNASAGVKKSTTTKKPGQTRKGTQNIAPKKSAALKRQKKLTHQLSSGLVAQTEKMLSARAGHLELLGGGRNKGKGTGKEKGEKGSKGKGKGK